MWLWCCSHVSHIKACLAFEGASRVTLGHCVVHLAFIWEAELHVCLTGNEASFFVMKCWIACVSLTKLVRDISLRMLEELTIILFYTWVDFCIKCAFDGLKVVLGSVLTFPSRRSSSPILIGLKVTSLLNHWIGFDGLDPLFIALVLLKLPELFRLESGDIEGGLALGELLGSLWTF